MASVEDFTASDGILRSLLTKTVNGKPIPLYPRSSAEVIAYNDNSVEYALNQIKNTVSNLSSLTSSISSSIRDLDNSKYSKTYIDTNLNLIQDSINSINLRVISTEAFIRDLDTYNKSEIDQKINSLSSSTESSLNAINSRFNDIRTFMQNEYYNQSEIDDKVFTITSRIDSTMDTINNSVSTKLLQYEAELKDILADVLMSYYDKDYIDNLESTMADDIEDTKSDVNRLREETNSMNAQSVIDINSHTDAMKSSIIQNSDNKFDTLGDNMESQFSNTNEIIEVVTERIIGYLNSVNSSVNTNVTNAINSAVSTLGNKIDNISVDPDSDGGSSGGGDDPTPVITYENADEEVY